MKIRTQVIAGLIISLGCLIITQCSHDELEAEPCRTCNEGEQRECSWNSQRVSQTLLVFGSLLLHTCAGGKCVDVCRMVNLIYFYCMSCLKSVPGVSGLLVESFSECRMNFLHTELLTECLALCSPALWPARRLRPNLALPSTSTVCSKPLGCTMTLAAGSCKRIL